MKYTTTIVLDLNTEMYKELKLDNNNNLLLKFTLIYDYITDIYYKNYIIKDIYDVFLVDLKGNILDFNINLNSEFKYLITEHEDFNKLIWKDIDERNKY